MSPSNRVLSALLGLTVCAPMLVGCSGSSADPPAAAAGTRSASVQSTSSTLSQECPNPEGGTCLGPLEPGSYQTSTFRPDLGYAVPTGWVNGEDLPGNFLLYRDHDPQEGFVGGSYMGIFTDVHAAARDCEEAWQGGVGSTPAELARWYRSLPGLRVTKPKPVTVGGLAGLLVDIALRRDYTKTCPWSEGQPVIPLIIGSGVSSLYHVVLHELTVRLVMLSWAGRNVTIEITSVRDQTSHADYVRTTQPIVDSLEFTP